MDWRTMLAHVAGTVDEGLRLRNEYLLAENRILRSRLATKQRLTDLRRLRPGAVRPRGAQE